VAANTATCIHLYVLNCRLHTEGSFKFLHAASAAEVINIKWDGKIIIS